MNHKLDLIMLINVNVFIADDDSSDSGSKTGTNACGMILYVISWMFIIGTFPLSLLFCVRVSNWINNWITLEFDYFKGHSGIWKGSYISFR